MKAQDELFLLNYLLELERKPMDPQISEMVAHILQATLLVENFSLVGHHNILKGKLYGVNTSIASTRLDDNDEC